MILKLDEQSIKKNKKVNLIYRSANSTNPKYKVLYDQLKQNVEKIGVPVSRFPQQQVDELTKVSTTLRFQS